jgi:hypothetical protein
MKPRRVFWLIVIASLVSILSIATIRAIQRKARCGGTITECVALAKERGVKEIFIAPPRSEYGDLTEFSKVLSHCLIVKAHLLSEAAQSDDTSIYTYRKYRVDVLHRPSERCVNCNSPLTVPSEVTPGDGEMVVPFEGGTIVRDGIKVTMEPFESDGDVGKSQNLVLILRQDEHNPRLGHMLVGPKGAYRLRTINGVELLLVNDGPEYWYAHPLYELFGYQQTKLSFSDFEKKLREASATRNKT